MGPAASSFSLYLLLAAATSLLLPPPAHAVPFEFSKCDTANGTAVRIMEVREVDATPDFLVGDKPVMFNITVNTAIAIQPDRVDVTFRLSGLRPYIPDMGSHTQRLSDYTLSGSPVVGEFVISRTDTFPPNFNQVPNVYVYEMSLTYNQMILTCINFAFPIAADYSNSVE